MRRKKLHISLAALLSALSHGIPHAVAQITINLPEANIQGRTDYIQSFTGGQYSFTLLALLPTISTKAINNTSFVSTTGGTVPLNVAHLKLEKINNLSLLGLSNDVTLSTADQVLISALATVSLSAGPVIINSRFVTANQTWVSGIYKTTLSLTASGILGGTITPPSQDFSISVPAFISPPASIGTTSILVNDLSYYRAANGISSNTVIPLSTTVPYIPSIKTGNTQFNFSTTAAYNALPVTSVSTVNTTLTGTANTTTAALSTTDQSLTNTAGIAVPTNNSQSLTYTYSIGLNQLKTNFIQAGTYSVPLTYTWNKLMSAYPIGSLLAQSNGNLSIVVSDLAEIVANQQAVNLSFTTANDYKNGVNVNMSNHLKLSATSSYNLYVRATSPSFTSGANSIPLNVLNIGPMAGQSGMNTVTLSTTAQQLIQNADPVIDRNLNMLYSIPASATGMLLNKPAGAYTANIIFSFVAP
ncbi:hypothetical protein D7322_25120 [Sphingobacterium puteale]|uniref:DUF4402 domain-containing protein n=1 Tax=Sphingobacterium puteale TaxID=2420510 RepID=A0A420VRB0_9SPHI|nr:hypothetical protein [Sphingobacterium puteale]RKO68891.1 hypothetical protein D7322_25120 [Sphingobacterium puteale]